MTTHVDTETQQPDPIVQALTVIANFSAGERINFYGRDKALDGESLSTADADDRTLVLASVGIAIAYHLARIADAVEQHNAF